MNILAGTSEDLTPRSILIISARRVLADGGPIVQINITERRKFRAAKYVMQVKMKGKINTRLPHTICSPRRVNASPENGPSVYATSENSRATIEGVATSDILIYWRNFNFKFRRVLCD